MPSDHREISIGKGEIGEPLFAVQFRCRVAGGIYR
jgi:hypothetical protein